MVTCLKGILPIESLHPLITRLCKITWQIIYYHYLHCHSVYGPPNFRGWWLTLSGSCSQSYTTLWSRDFTRSRDTGQSIWGKNDNGNQRGGHNSGQNNFIYNIQSYLFFRGKVTFMVTFKEKIIFIFTSLLSKGHM